MATEWIPFTVESIAFYGLICFTVGNISMYIILEELKPYSQTIRRKYG